ncbi:MAG TPA: aminotransferase class I/II-fold pyridoxal phosphate-dependent enzyme, partial [Ktedonobacterales bacterium]
QIGLTVETPLASLYVWPRIPEGITSAQFALDLLDRTGVAVTPGTNFGPRGEGYLRISLTVPDAQLDTAVERLRSAVATPSARA